MHEPIECRGGVEHQRPQLTGRLVGTESRHARHAVRRIGRGTGLETQRVGEPPGGIDGDHDDSTAGARRRNAEGRRRGGLSDAAGTARDDQCRRGHLIGERLGNVALACTHVDTSSGSMSGSDQRIGEHAEMVERESWRRQARKRHHRALERRAEPVDLLMLAIEALATEFARRGQRHLRRRRQGDLLRTRRHRGCLVQARSFGPAGIDHEWQQGHPDVAGQLVRQLDGFGDRRLLRQRDDHRLAPSRIAQHGIDLDGLIPHGSGLYDVGEPGRRTEKRCSMTGGRRVDDDQVGRPFSFEFLDLAEHEQVFEAGRGRRDHRE